MENKTIHVITDWACLSLMIGGIAAGFIHQGFILFFIAGMLGMMMNEKVNPYDAKEVII